MKTNNNIKYRYIYIPKKDIYLTAAKNDGITVIKHVNQDFINMLIKQNKADLIEFCEGCLLDNYLYSCNNGYMSVVESYLNCWCSDYTVYFSRDNKVYDQFYSDFAAVIYNEEF